jgi:hypothetical protein
MAIKMTASDFVRAGRSNSVYCGPFRTAQAFGKTVFSALQLIPDGDTKGVLQPRATAAMSKIR